MNSSLFTLDRATHLKILMVAAITAVVVLMVGENARLDRTAFAAPAPVAGQPLLQPRPQPVWRATPTRLPLMPAANAVPHQSV
jgi:hypothetical protein